MDVQDATTTSEQAAKSPTFQTKEVNGATKKYVGEPISFSLRDADIKEVLRTFAKISGLNIVVQPGVTGRSPSSSSRSPGTRRSRRS